MTRRRRRRKKRDPGLPRAKRQKIGPNGEQGPRYTLEDVFSGMRTALNGGTERFYTADGEDWKMSTRMLTFLEKGVVCRYCKLEGAYFQAERFSLNEKKFHLNLYAVDYEGDEVLMTHDHHVPRGSGGKDALGNTDTACTTCNSYKAGLIPSFATQTHRKVARPSLHG